MRLTPQERDRLLIASAAALAHRRRERGLRLNVPETVAVVADAAIEAARDGLRLEEAVRRAQSVLAPDDVLPGVADIVTEVRVEAVFDDGTRLAVVPDPVGTGATRDPAGVAGDVPASQAGDGPGAVLVAGGARELGSAGHNPIHVRVVNTSSVPISVTSHWHFFEANPRLRFDRRAAYGRRLAVPAGASVRFPPGDPVEVDLVPFGGLRVVVGFAGLVDGALDDPAVATEAMRRVRELGYLDVAPSDAGGSEDER